MFGFALQIVNLRDLHRAHERVLARTDTALAEAQVEAGQHAVEHVRHFPGFKPRTGNLQKRTGYRTVRTSNGRLLTVFNGARYAGPIDKGSPPHIIRARRGRALKFVVGGRVVFRRQVNHPGNRPYRFLQRATLAAGSLFERTMVAKMSAVARRF